MTLLQEFKVEDNGAILCKIHGIPAHRKTVQTAGHNPGRIYFKCTSKLRELDRVDTSCPAFSWEEDPTSGDIGDSLDKVKIYYHLHPELDETTEGADRLRRFRPQKRPVPAGPQSMQDALNHTINRSAVPWRRVSPAGERSLDIVQIPGEAEAQAPPPAAPTIEPAKIATADLSVTEMDAMIDEHQREAAKRPEEVQRLERLKAYPLNLEKQKKLAEQNVKVKTDYIATMEGLRKN